jgi:hypothetical protein
MSPWIDKLRRIARSPRVDGLLLPAIWIVLTCVNLMPIWHQRMLPQLDSPNHLALIRGWHSFSDSAYHIGDFYSQRIKPVPYILFYTAVHYLMYVFSIETANKVFLSFYVILFPLSVLSVARALGRSPWLCLGAFPLTFNPSWIYGYSSLLIGNCFCFLALGALISYLTKKRQHNLLLVLLWSTLTYFSHILPWFVFGVTAMCLLVLHWRDWREGLRAAGAMLPSVMFALVAVLEESFEHAYVHQGKAFSYQWRDVPTLFEELPGRLLEIFPGKLDMAVLAVIVATTTALCVWRGVRLDGAGEHRHQKIFLWLMALLYLCLPYQITGPLVFFQMAQRIPVMGAVVALLLPAGVFTGRQRLVFVPLIVASLALPMKMTRLYGAFSRRYEPFMELLDQVPLGQPTFVVMRHMWNVTGPVAESSADPSTSGPVHWHFMSWPMALRGGYSPYLFDQGIPIRYKKRLAAPQWNTLDYFELKQAPEFEYYLVNDPPDSLLGAPELRWVDQKGDWWLFQRWHPPTDEP